MNSPSPSPFTGARFLIVPTREEIASDILIPGHRFIPFYAPAIKPRKLRAFMNGVELPRTDLNAAMGDLGIYYSLFGSNRLVEFLINDDRKNAALLTETSEEKEAIVSVFDMARPYRKLGFKPGDGFIATVRDWAKGEFVLIHTPARELLERQDEIREWNERFEAAFLRAIDTIGPDADMEEQLAAAVLDAGPWIIQHPVVTIAQFVNQNNTIGIGKAHEEQRFIHKDLSSVDHVRSAAADEKSGVDSDFDELTRLFMRNELIMTSALYEGYIKDALFNHLGDTEHLDIELFGEKWRERLEKNNDTCEFEALTRKLREKITAAYDREADAYSGPLRSYCITLLEKALNALSDLAEEDRFDRTDDDPDSEDPFTLMNMLVAQIHAIIALLNDPAGIGKDDAADFRESLGKVDASLELLATEGPSDLPRESPPVKKPIQSDSAYLLDVTIDGIEPQIRRRLRVPSVVTLRQLHESIQAVMGWRDCHLHEFLVDGKRFGLPSDEDLGTVADDSEYLLGEVLGIDVSAFSYQYDFGDDWECTVKVVAVETAAGPVVSAVPELVEGEGASPPEDSGGVVGYLGLIAALGGADAGAKAFAADTLGRAFDPRRFDLKKTQNRLVSGIKKGSGHGKR
jgi:hypothetical protein